MVASLPRPPKLENTKGVKEADYNSNTISIFSFLLKFMSTKQRSYPSLVIARCVGMKHPNIKNASCMSSIPKPSGMDISPSIISVISRSSV